LQIGERSMDIRINEMTSRVSVTDARAMLSPEVLQQIAEAVAAYLRAQQEAEKSREQDTRIDRRAAPLD
jgi:hypothetical protein